MVASQLRGQRFESQCWYAHTYDFNLRIAYIWNIPWLGIGIWCNGCPPKGCDDDEAVIHGYCCGCAHALDKLPVMCPEFLQCPLNLHGLCHDYEYMMRCCC
ncbi:uncharacterized protein LOC113226675 [Hyposmocoma kahamanoa]|uniref:uncharacterized protein LOC113226675 n=1 Tax=Hyposmocoma kahamanoa TaxID=1477025 RepID=UPI000E6D7CB5|nr:uncharacterized protein LOC113226675 [Hyposmocoma kahamanoa]